MEIRPAGGGRQGSVLLVVLVVVALLALGAYSFTEIMLSEMEAATAWGRDAQARAMADSGIELAAAWLGTRSPDGDEFYHNPELFQGVLMHEGTGERGNGRFSIVAPVEHNPSADFVRFGLTDESGKLNLNALVRLDLDDDQMRQALLFLPGMTFEIADAILDFIDEDQQPRQFGCEDEYYTGLNPPYMAKNGPLESLEELLLVRGVTPALLFGEDANRNGLLDPNEDDGELSPPLDNADGILDPGWSAFLTVHSREANRRLDGRPRINVNHGMLTELYDTLELEFGPEVARFVVAWRMNGPVLPDGEQSDESGTSGRGGQGGRGGGGGDSGGRGSGGRGAAGGGGGASGGSGGGLERAAQGLARGLFGGDRAGDGQVTRGGLDLSGGGRNQVTSLYDLVGAQVSAQVEGSETETVLDSPWPADPGSMAQYLPELLDGLRLNDDEFIPGRININQARREVLLGLPGMSEALADAIIAARPIGAGGEPLPQMTATRRTTGWLLMEGLVDLEQMRLLDPYITARGDVYRMQAIGHFDGGGPACRLEAVIDASRWPPRTIFTRDLTHLGRGYTQRHLMP